MAKTTLSNLLLHHNSAALFRLLSLRLHTDVDDFRTTHFVSDMTFGENCPQLEKVTLAACFGPGNLPLLSPPRRVARVVTENSGTFPRSFGI